MKANQRDVTKEEEKITRGISGRTEAAGGSSSVYKEQQGSGQQPSNSKRNRESARGGITQKTSEVHLAGGGGHMSHLTAPQ